jgi:predicted transcriptional regulator
MKDDDKLEMTFTRVQWRLIAIACAKLRPTDVIGGEIMKPEADRIALAIASRTRQP